MKYLEYFAKNLKYYRQKKKLTQAQLAEMLNVHVSTIARIETAEHQASYKNIDSLVEILGITYGQFFNYFEANEKNKEQNDLVEKINILMRDMTSEDLKHFLVNMESYLATQKIKEKNS